MYILLNLIVILIVIITIISLAVYASMCIVGFIIKWEIKKQWEFEAEAKERWLNMPKTEREEHWLH